MLHRCPTVVFTLILTAACSSGGSSPSGPGGGSHTSATGHWTYILPAIPDIGPVVDLTLTENSSGTITGTGKIYDTDHYDAVVSGSHSGSTVTLTATTSVCTALFSGSFIDNNTITGTAVKQSGVSGRDCRQGTWTLKRQ
jgi:hypothetical protein